MEKIIDLFEKIPSFDLIYIIITVLTLIKCTKRGFVLSILSAARWLLAYVITLFLFPKIKPYVKGTISNEYVLDTLLGLSLFVFIIFIILMINKGISKAVTYSGMGTLDKIFGFFFGFLKGYVIAVCVFATINIVYNHKNWPLDLKKSFSFPWVEKGNNYLIKEFPNEKQYKDAKEKVQEL
tara:strand:- start:31 stop:573 length:543 start_codon:yes stop_codon:yes gene_type:complete